MLFYESIDELDLSDHKDQEIIKNETITLEYTVNGNNETLKLRSMG